MTDEGMVLEGKYFSDDAIDERAQDLRASSFLFIYIYISSCEVLIPYFHRSHHSLAGEKCWHGVQRSRYSSRMLPISNSKVPSFSWLTVNAWTKTLPLPGHRAEAIGPKRYSRRAVPLPPDCCWGQGTARAAASRAWAGQGALPCCWACHATACAGRASAARLHVA